MVHHHLGTVLVLVFVVCQAARDVYFAGVFQALDVFEVTLVAFCACTLIFAGVASARDPGGWRRLAGHRRALLRINLLTAGAWLAFFLALKSLEPAIVATLYGGAGPIAILCWARRGGGQGSTPLGLWIYGALAATLAGLWLVVLSGRSGLGAGDVATGLAACALATGGGVLIALGHLGTRRLNDAGIGADTVMATRFLGLVLAAGLVEMLDGSAIAIAGNVIEIAGAAVLLIVLPSFALQLGIARARPMQVNALRATAPVFVFAVQFADDRLHFAPATLACVLIYAALALTGALVEGRTKDEGPAGTAGEASARSPAA